jgi:hypothetical protein
MKNETVAGLRLFYDAEQQEAAKVSRQNRGFHPQSPELRCIK